MPPVQQKVMGKSKVPEARNRDFENGLQGLWVGKCLQPVQAVLCERPRSLPPEEADGRLRAGPKTGKVMPERDSQAETRRGGHALHPRGPATTQLQLTAPFPAPGTHIWKLGTQLAESLILQKIHK